MQESAIRVKIENFRALSNADIIIDGITLVTGENGSGKSTLSRLLYNLYKTAINYDELVTRELEDKLENIERFIDIILSDLYSVGSDRNTREEFQELRSLTSSPIYLTDEYKERWIYLLEKIANNYKSQPILFNSSNNINITRNRRLRFILMDILEDESLAINNEGVPFNKLVDLINSLFKNAIRDSKMRPSLIFKTELQNSFAQQNLPELFEVYEYGETIFSMKKNNISIPYTVQNTVYIDTPMLIGIDESNNEYWNETNSLLREKNRLAFSTLDSVISNEIINGEIDIEDNSFAPSDFTYKRLDGAVFNLLDCATGIKSFGILQLLLKNGSLNDKTLLIIDEPESHLHPQWIIEYARVIVLLNKELGVKFFLTSHNPDMVSAIKYISEKEGQTESLHYYLAEIDKTKNYAYTYTHLGNDINPIFESFNIALDRITQYGS